MTARWSIALVLAALAAAYAASGGATQAQAAGDVPFSVGDRVYAGQALSSTVDCTVAEFQSGYVRCVPADGFKASRYDTWYSLRQVIRVLKHGK
jgi:hypothetical protein